MTADQSSPIGASSVQEVQKDQRKTNYSQQLKDKQWRSKRLVIIAKANHKCQECGIGGKLDVHHLYYIRGKKPWQHPYKALIALCRKCHTEWHENNRLEYRDEVWSSLKEYQAPKNRKIYIVKKGKKSIKKEVPYRKKIKQVLPSGIRVKTPTPLQKAQKKRRKRTENFKLTIPETIVRSDGVILYTKDLTYEQTKFFMRKYKVV